MHNYVNSRRKRGDLLYLGCDAFDNVSSANLCKHNQSLKCNKSHVQIAQLCTHSAQTNQLFLVTQRMTLIMQSKTLMIPPMVPMYLISSLSKHLTKSPEASLGAIPKQSPHQRVGHSSFRALGVGPYMRLSFVELECSAKAVVSSHATNISVDASEALSNRAIAKEGQPFHLELDKQQCPWVKENIKPMRKINANSRGKNIIKIQC